MSDDDTPDESPSGAAGGGNSGFFASATTESAGTPHARKHHGFFRRHLALTSLGIIILVIVIAAGGFIFYLNSLLGNIKTFQAGVTQRTDSHGQVIPDAGHAFNVLLLGSDDGNNVQTVADDLADGHWTPGLHRSDTIMIAHITANRRSVQLVSIPRDSWVKVDGFPGDVDGYAKINAAFSWGGPALAVKTVQDLTGLHIDHVAMIDWNGFKGLTDALGGVRLYIPHTFTDDTQHVTWTQGWHTMDGAQALQYVRTRHGLSNGDFGRIERQQNFLRTMSHSLLTTSTFTNPIKLTRVLSTMTKFIEVDNTWTTGDLRSLALSMRHLRSNDVQFTTAPLGSYDVVAGQDIVRLDATKCQQLFKDLNNGQLGKYLAANPGSALPSDTNVN